MKKKVEWNINNYVTVELCDYGIEIYKNHLTEMYNLIKQKGNIQEQVDIRMQKLKANGNKLRLQGWDMINIFGNYLILGSPAVFKECIWKVEIEE